MAANPIIALGLVVGVVASIIVYIRRRNIKDSIVAFFLGFLASGTPLHFVLVGYYVGSWVNRQIYRRWSHNWGSFLVSLLGIIPLIGVWQGVLKVLLALSVSVVNNAGGAIILGVGLAYLFILLMLLGSGVYIVSSLYVSFRRRGAETN